MQRHLDEPPRQFAHISPPGRAPALDPRLRRHLRQQDLRPQLRAAHVVPDGAVPAHPAAAALLCRSSDLAAVASITHALDFARLIVIEEPHMKKIYTRRIRRAGFKETLQKLKIR